MGAVDDAQTRAQNQNLVDGSTGWPSETDVWHDDTDQLVGFFSDGGPGPEVRTGEEHPNVQVRTRGQPFDSDAAKDRLRQIRNDLHGLLDVTIDGTSYVEITALGEPAPLGLDENGRPEFTQSFRFER